MATATNIEATAVNTVSWLSEPGRAIVVPVYQRQYRWDIGGCEKLLADIRAVAHLGSEDAARMHFIGSILSSADHEDGADELVLIDGQQRITTLMLLVAALAHAVTDTDPALAAELRAVLLRDGTSETRLRPHRAWAEAFDAVVHGRDTPGAQSRFADNYTFFRSQVSAADAPLIWSGLRRLEHVAITLGAGADAQQIFESLNSTGEPLRDHELIHNYVLMGLTHAEQTEIEQDYWLPIERDTGQSIADFWRHYLVLTTGREVASVDGRGVYDAFRARFPRLGIAELRRAADEWRDYARVYGDLLDPARRGDAVGAQLADVAVFGSDAFPLVMREVRERDAGRLGDADLTGILQLVQTLLLRRSVIGLPIDRLVARLCRARAAGIDELRAAVARITPSDERVRVALRYGALPHAPYVLRRISQADAAGLVIDHIAPLAPGDVFSLDGRRAFAELSDDEQNSLRALTPTIGNLVLVEESVADRAFDASFPERAALYAASAVTTTAELGAQAEWSTAAIAARTRLLADRFVETWPRPDAAGIDDDGLTPILDATLRRGWPRGWQREFDYVEYRGEHWEVPDVKYLFNRIFRRLWADRRDAVIAFSEHRGGPIYPAASWTGAWDELDAEHHLYLGWDSRYMLAAVQGVLEQAGFAAEVFLKYSHIGNAMR